ncbi:hypothetical protein RIVM261_050910 [Rivularia sp. IAM M-261]|nr:hypothetical protein RIVM261_050910 [Rivularia sp. IAM M-261]
MKQKLLSTHFRKCREDVRLQQVDKRAGYVMSDDVITVVLLLYTVANYPISRVYPSLNLPH